MLNALRLNAGFAEDDFERRTGLPLSSVQARLAQAQERGWLSRRDGVIAPTETGRRYLNDLLETFLND